MPWLRYKRWRYATPLVPHVAVCASGRRYLWKGDAKGVTDVPYQGDVEELLNPLGDQQSVYEVAWDRYGVAFDAQGKECPPAPPISCEPTQATGAVSETVVVGPVKPRGRPRKR